LKRRLFDPFIQLIVSFCSAGLIFFKKDAPEKPSDKTNPEKKEEKKVEKLDLENLVNFSVFPSIQGGPHNNTIAAVAVQLKEVATEEFRNYAKQIVKNAKSLAAALMKLGHKVVTNGTDNHLLLWDLRPLGLNGNKFQEFCDHVSITLNKNAIYGDTNMLSPSGVRVGTPALTSRGFKETDFEKVAAFLDS
jgi:glycine hydroxymethyltransferase